MSTPEELAALEMRLYRLEIQLLGVKLSSDDTEKSKPQQPTQQQTPPPRTPSSNTSAAAGNIASPVAKLNLGFEEETAVLDTEPQNKPTEDDDFATRLTALEQIAATSSTHRDALEGHWREIHQYLQDLDPGTALTHQQQIAGPIVYRRQEILASADELKRNMQYVAEILNLLLIGQNLPTTTTTSSSTTALGHGGSSVATTPGKSSSASSVLSSLSSSSSSSDLIITEMHVTKAPILLQMPALSREEQDDLASLQDLLEGLSDRVNAAASKLDRLLTAYQTLVTAVSEKLVLLHEEARIGQQQ